MFKVNDFFCGAGGMGLGFKQANFRLAGAWDFDKYAVESYGNNVSPKVKRADISEMKWDEVPHADVWTFGFPCQDISTAGKQKGMIKGETRSGLFYEVMRLLEETNHNNKLQLPKIILAENVKAVKKYLPTIESEYDANGYKMYAKLYNSKYHGVPQNRERYFIIGVHHSIDREFVFKDEVSDCVPRLSSILEDVVDEKYYIKGDKAKSVIEQAAKRVQLLGTHACITPDRVDKRQNGRRAKGNEEEMFTLTAQDLHGVIVDNNQQGNENIKIQNICNINPSGKGMNGNVYSSEGVCPCLTTNKGEGFKIVIPTPIMNAGAAYTVTTRAHAQPVIHGIDRKQGEWRVRRLTPREYARLQGFPDDFEQVVSNSQFYKQMGNAVTVNVSRFIAGQINDFLSEIEFKGEIV